MTAANGQSHSLIFDYRSERIGQSGIVHADCFEWLARVPQNSLHAVVTDPPYGVKEYDLDQLRSGPTATAASGVFHRRSTAIPAPPLPRFTALDAAERDRVRRFFIDWGKLRCHALRPGGHVFIATNAFIAQLLYGALVEGGLEFRGQLIRLVRTLRGGDRPKNAESEFPGVSSMPKGCYEPWGVFRKPLPPQNDRGRMPAAMADGRLAADGRRPAV